MKTTALLALLVMFVNLSEPAQAQHQIRSYYYPPTGAYDSVGFVDVVRKVQYALEAEGYYVGDHAGNYGWETRTAVRRYQRDHGLPMTNRIDPETLRSLGIR